MEVSVILCTHNPNAEFLKRTLEALRLQTTPVQEWELLLVDNASEVPVSSRFDLGWHPNGRIVPEPTLGLTPARLTGLSEAKGDLMIFVDDDNLLAPDFLDLAIKIAREMPWIGAFGGSIEGAFETEPEEEVRFLLPHLALRAVSEAQWACRPGIAALDVSPWGAGMVIRRAVALEYQSRVREDPLRGKLDRVGDLLSSAGDSDMALCACSRGLAVGLFPQLRLVHIIPAKRLTKPYLLRLAEGNAFSHAVLRFIWEGKLPPAPENIRPAPADRLLAAYKAFRKRLRGDRATFAEQVRKVEVRGRLRAREVLLPMAATSCQSAD